MSQNQPEEDDDETEQPGAWLFAMMADLGMMGPEIAEDDEEPDSEK